jgi:CRISPR-associated protein Cmr2
MTQSILKMQVGPVQDFIAQARSTRDMWAGSYLLSWLTAAAMKAFQDHPECTFIFPQLDDQPLYKMFCNSPSPEGLIPTLPNVFLVLVPQGMAQSLAQDADKQLRKKLKEISETCWDHLKQQFEDQSLNTYKDRWDDQVSRFPIINWHAVDYSTEDHKGSIERLNKHMAARRNTREFPQWGTVTKENGDIAWDNSLQGAAKDVLSGKEEIIGGKNLWEGNDAYDWKKAGPFGAMNCIKRLFPEAVLERKFGDLKVFWKEMSVSNTRDLAAMNRAGVSDHLKDEDEKPLPFNPYMAVIAMDGDRMGAALDKIEEVERHKAFSQALATFSEELVKPIVTDKGGQLVYAGGDDVLALCPADQALAIAAELRKAFLDAMEEFRMLDPAKPLDASCGIAVAHYKYPLQRAVHEARQAEKRAKTQRGRAAFELTLLKHSGETVHWGAKWDSKALAVYDDFNKKVDTEALSGRFAYALNELLAPYKLEQPPEAGVALKEIVRKEFRHVQIRQANVKGAIVDSAEAYLDEADLDLQDFPKLFLAATFMTRLRGEK